MAFGVLVIPPRNEERDLILDDRNHQLAVSLFLLQNGFTFTIDILDELLKRTILPEA